jgi:hypothetical protein
MVIIQGSGFKGSGFTEKLIRKVYGLTKKAKFSHDFGLKGQI